MVGRHQLDGLAHRVRGCDPEELVALLTQQMTDGLHENPPKLTGPKALHGKSGRGKSASVPNDYTPASCQDK